MSIKNIIAIPLVLAIASCKTTIKLSIPEVFAKQATAFHVQGARKNKMTVGLYSTSRIKRGMHVTYPGSSGQYFFVENLVLNKVGLNKSEDFIKEKAKFRYVLSDTKYKVEVYGREKEVTRSITYGLLNTNTHNKYGFLNELSQLQQYTYVFSAILKVDSLPNAAHWELVMTNLYDREQDTTNNRLFPFVRPDDNGLATNGTDSIFIKPVSIQNTEGSNGKKGKLPFKMLSGYELSTSDGVIAIIDLIGFNVWLYNELNEKERLILTAITTALFARKVNDTKW